MAQTVTLIPGDGIGPDLTDSVKEVIGALDVDIEWEIAEAGETVMDKEGTPLPESVLESIRRNKVAIKGPLTTPVGTGFRSVNVALRKELDLYGNIRPSLSLPGIETAVQEHRHHHLPREHRGPLRRRGAHGRQARGGVDQDHHPRGHRAHLPHGLRAVQGAGPQAHHRRPQGEHHEVHRRPLQGRLLRGRQRSTRTTSRR